MRPGDIVRVIKIPTGLPVESQSVFELCVGRCFAVERIEGDGRIELLVGHVLGAKDFEHSLYLWPDEVEPANNPS
jgi:hypothetical protein